MRKKLIFNTSLVYLKWFVYCFTCFMTILLFSSISFIVIYSLLLRWNSILLCFASNPLNVLFWWSRLCFCLDTENKKNTHAYRVSTRWRLSRGGRTKAGRNHPFRGAHPTKRSESAFPVGRTVGRLTDVVPTESRRARLPASAPKSKTLDIRRRVYMFAVLGRSGLRPVAFLRRMPPRSKPSCASLLAPVAK